MKVKKLIDRVQSIYSKGVQSDDSRLSNRLIYNKLLTTRSKLISQKIKKKQRVSQWNYQTIPCVKLVEVPKHQCPCIPPVGCKILRSEHKLPEPISGFNEDLIQSVTSIERSIKIDRISINAVNFQRGNKYTSTKVNFFVQDGYIYLTTPTDISIISIVALFENPIEVKNFLSYCSDCVECNKCIDYLEEDFPIDNDMIDTLIELTLNEVVILFSKSIEDVSNNSIDSIKEQSK